ncbi:unnamed protein product [Phytomonas sp. EM1]|nr:unnamed protein product [Phytomonas sp. EM1]|eukprot:CCW62457.1 unnamed protein product [Phytomonas sp. isolate EM1]
MSKLVDDTDSCKDGAPSAGLPINTNLYPKNNFGPNTTYAFWTVVTKKSGSYKVCYKRRGEEWTEIPSIHIAWPQVGPTQNSTPTSFPIPIDPVTKEACPTAPTGGDPWVDYSSLRFKMKKRKPMDVFANMIVNLFCVPRSAFTIIRMTHEIDGQQVVYVVFACSGVLLKDGRPACDTIERSNYAVTLSKVNSTLLQVNDIDEISGSTSIASAGDDPDVSPRVRSFFPTLIICITALACSGMLVFAVLKYRERRQYFVQFGMDDDGIDDMYIPAMMSAGMDGTGHHDTNHSPSQDLDENLMRDIRIKVNK